MKEEMEAWKVNWEKKKGEIEEKEKIKINEEKEYQGELENGKRNGFGIIFIHSGEFKGHRYEG